MHFKFDFNLERNNHSNIKIRHKSQLIIGDRFKRNESNKKLFFTVISNQTQPESIPQA